MLLRLVIISAAHEIAATVAHQLTALLGQPPAAHRTVQHGLLVGWSGIFGLAFGACVGSHPDATIIMSLAR
jgi:hypothetical protein